MVRCCSDRQAWFGIERAPGSRSGPFTHVRADGANERGVALWVAHADLARRPAQALLVPKHRALHTPVHVRALVHNEANLLHASAEATRGIDARILGPHPCTLRARIHVERTTVRSGLFIEAVQEYPWGASCL